MMEEGGNSKSSMIEKGDERRQSVTLDTVEGGTVEMKKSQKILRTFCLYFTYLCKGLVIAILGASLLDFESQTGCSSQEAALLLTWSSLGRLPGSLLAAIVFDRLAPELQQMAALVVMGTVVSVLPWLTSYPVLSAAIFLQGVCIGYLGGGCNSYCFALWGEKSAPVIQGLHFTLSAGCSLAPLIASPFLTARWDPALASAACRNLSGAAGNGSGCPEAGLGLAEAELLLGAGDPQMETAMVYEELLYMTHGVRAANGSDVLVTTVDGGDDTHLALPSNLFYPCVIVVGFLVIAITVAMVIFAKDKCAVTRAPSARPAREGAVDTRHVAFLALFSLYFLCLGGLETTYGGLLVTFSVRTLGWRKSDAMYVTTLYWTCLAGGRALGIPLTRLVSSEVIAAADVVMATTSIAVLTFAHGLHPMVTWVCSGVFGLSIATGIVNGLVICSRTLRMSSRLASFLMGSVFAGMMVVPAVASTLIKRASPLSLLHVTLAVSCLLLASYAAVIIYTRLVLRPPPHGSIRQDKQYRGDDRRDRTTSGESSTSTATGKSDATTTTYSSEAEPFLDVIEALDTIQKQEQGNVIT